MNSFRTADFCIEAVDVVHNAFIARTDVLRRHAWREELQVNEHMTFFPRRA